MKNEQILGLVNPLIALTFAITFFVLWSRQQHRQYILAIAFSYFMLGTGFLVSHLAKDVTGMVHVVGTHFFYSVGTISMVWAVCTRTGHRTPLLFLSSLAVIGCLGLLYLQFVNPIGNGRLFVSNTVYGLMFAAGSVILLRNWKVGAIEKLLLVMFVLTMVQFWVRPAVTLSLEGVVDTETYRESAYYSILNVTVALLSIMLAISLIAACTSDLFNEVKRRTEDDALTGLKIRRVFEEKAAYLFDEFERKQLPISMIVADIDYFKRVNDNYGHQIGDNAIAEFGRLLKENSRQDDLIGRIGGEEFCVILWNSDVLGAQLLAESMRTSFSMVQVKGMPAGHHLTASFGVAEAVQGDDYGRLFGKADAALYDAKKSGRDRVMRHVSLKVHAPVQQVVS